uniref:DUF4773 domain-containing protein n=2 Tax=Macrostomum lignano TaxID=282301 RepID=A0A1I8H5S3_9PLAT
PNLQLDELSLWLKYKKILLSVNFQNNKEMPRLSFRCCKRFFCCKQNFLLCILLCAMALIMLHYAWIGASDGSSINSDLDAANSNGHTDSSRLGYAKAFYNKLRGNLKGNASSLIGAGQVLIGPASRHFAFNYNVSQARLAELLADTMQMMELQKTAHKTLAYMVSIQPDFDANAGSCRCGSISELCHCCARVALRPIRLEQTVCIDFRYEVHRKSLRTRIVLANSGTVVVEQLLGAARPPVLCAGSALELCASFRNTSYTVMLHSEHKTRLRGCLDLLVNLVNSTVAAYPMGCFEAHGRSGGGPQQIAGNIIN